MLVVRLLLPFVALILLPSLALAHDDHSPAALKLSVWSVLPFALLLLAIAVLPLVAGHWWHSNRNKGIVCVALSLPILIYLIYLEQATNQPALTVLGHQMFEYVSFIVLLGTLYIVSGGIVLHGDIRATPLVNTLFLSVGVVLASFIGTTGASMLLIRPLLRTNSERQITGHLPIFFIFTVSNLGGLLTPLGDPPLFLGFLKGVPFEWTFSLWPQWLMANGIVLVLFFLWDSVAYASESRQALEKDDRQIQPLALTGTFNLLILLCIIPSVLVQRWVEGVFGQVIGLLLLITLAGLSWRFTARADRSANSFTWAPMVEVSVLFAGIFVVMLPALELLKSHGNDVGLTQAWHYFWLTGLLSSFLDNAPTYLAFATMAAGPDTLGALAQRSPELLAAISCGAVFFGANTYIGNGPNFMVKAIAEEAGYKTPSFFGYMLYSSLILLPIFVVISLVFFPAR